ncbi:ABC transporter substrate-binding protein [Desulfovibrio sp.]|uniref:ABC transporter substrate-binding protein n=1 Tax=Desulfovibrio sp. TaxID=885 RepID=UPI003D11F9EC
MEKKLSILALLLLLCLPAAPAGASTVTDALGRRVDVPEPEHISRILALGCSMGFITSLGAQDMVLAVEDIDKAPLAKPYIIANRDRFRDLPVVGKAGAARRYDFERIIGLKPDVIFIITSDPSEPELMQRKLRVPVLALSQGQPLYNEDVYLESLALVGRVLGREEQAAQLTTGVRNLTGRLRNHPVPQQQALAYVGGLSYKGNQDIKSTAGDFLPLKLAGIANIADTAGRKGNCFINKEFLLTANPRLIFIDANGLPLIQENIKAEPHYYQRLKAMTSGNTWLLLPHTTIFNTPEIMYINAFFMAKAAYPEAYAGLDLKALADEVFVLFNGVPLYEEMVRITGPVGRLHLTDKGLAHAAP